MAEYIPLELKKFAIKKDKEDIHWEKSMTPIIRQHFAPVTCINFSPVFPHEYIVTSGTEVEIFDPHTNEPTRTLSRFNSTVYSGYFRNDGNLLVTAGDDSVVRVFEIKTKTMLRSFKISTKPIHVAKFSPNSTSIIAVCDDSIVRQLDISTGTQVTSLTGHTDVVRSGAISEANHDMWISGSYDHTIRLWDVRTKGQVEKFDHEAPVEDVLFFPNGNLIVSAGGPIVKIWDILTGRVLQSLSNHQKTVTCLALDIERGHLYSGGLDHLVKVFSINTYNNVHTTKYAAPILSLGISPRDTHLVAGLSDGMLSIHHRREAKKQSASRLTRSTLRVDEFLTEKNVTRQFRPKNAKKQILKSYDKYLKRFQYNKAVDAAVESKNILGLVAVLEELIHRKCLQLVISKRNDRTIMKLLLMIKDNFADPMYSSVLLKVINCFLDIHTTNLGTSSEVDKIVCEMFEMVQAETESLTKMQEILGMVDMIFGASVAHRQ